MHCSLPSILPVHPHGRGDHDLETSSASDNIGSSSHAWGPPRSMGGAPTAQRFILTCVGTTPTIRSRNASASVHPHMRGDHSPMPSCCPRAAGSSSHAWGPLVDLFVLRYQSRFILTCVGTTAHRRFMRPANPVHPHMRGDHNQGSALFCVFAGSSSHAWGPPIKQNDHAMDARFILTCVGTTCWFAIRPPTGPVHPHMRGDHCCHCSPCHTTIGSSSHAWGPLDTPPSGIACKRFILTCVGTTSERW